MTESVLVQLLLSCVIKRDNGENNLGVCREIEGQVGGTEQF